MNKTYLYILYALCIGLSLFSPFNALAAQPADSPQLVYKPPTRGAPASRIGGGTRGISDDLPELFVLAPNHTGLTSKANPAIYWYMSKPVTAHLELTVIHDEAIDPVFEGEVGASNKNDIQGFSFSRNNISLEPGIEYQWFVSFSPDPQNRSRDIIAGGTIKRIELSPDVKKQMESATEQQLAILASQGIWYDTVDLLSKMISKNPENEKLKEQRAALLKQVGLPDF